MDLETIAASVAASTVSGCSVAWLTSRKALTQSRILAHNERRRRAAELLRNEIWRLRDLTWDALIGVPVDGRTIAHMMRNLQRTVTRYEDLLPQGAGHLSRSVREAASHVFGPPGAADLDVLLAAAMADPVDRYWADVSITWLEHAAARLHAWEDDPSIRRLAITEFFRWRRDEDAAWRLGGKSESLAD